MQHQLVEHIDYLQHQLIVFLLGCTHEGGGGGGGKTLRLSSCYIRTVYVQFLGDIIINVLTVQVWTHFIFTCSSSLWMVLGSY